MAFKVFENLLEFVIMVADEEKWRGSVQMRNLGINPDSVLDLNLTEVVNLPDPLLDGGRMAQPDQSLFDIDNL